jgi:hypothetical protein
MSGEKKKLSKADCVLCHREVEGNVDPQKIITCPRCVQILLMKDSRIPKYREEKIAFRDALIEKGDLEAARSVESFISPEEVAYEPTRKFRPTLVRKRPLRKVWAPLRKRPVRHDQLLDQGRAEIR